MTAPDWLTEAQIYCFAFRAQKIADPTRYARLSKADRADFLYYEAIVSGLAAAIGDDALQELIAAVWPAEIEAAA